MARTVPASHRHLGEARYRIRTLREQLDRLEATVTRVANAEAMDAERVIDMLRETLAILEGDVRRWRAEQKVEAGGQGSLR